MIETVLNADSPHWSAALVGHRWRWSAVTETSSASGWAETADAARTRALDTYGFLRRQERDDA